MRNLCAIILVLCIGLVCGIFITDNTRHVDPLTIHYGEDADSCFEFIGDPDALVWRDGRYFASWNGGMELVFDDQRRLIEVRHPASYVTIGR